MKIYIFDPTHIYGLFIIYYGHQCLWLNLEVPTAYSVFISIQEEVHFLLCIWMTF